ncbi:MAG: serine hydrolase domain-containing protein [Bacteroidales bacterium]
MIRSKILPAILLISLSLSLLLVYQGNTSTAERPIETEPVIEKVLTRADTLVMQYDTLITGLLDSANTVGAAVVITHNGEVIYQKCHGVREIGSADPVDPYTVFRLASVSKPVTGVLAGILAYDSIIGLDDKVVDYIPDFTLKDTFSTRELTVRNILSHSSGLVPHAYDNLVEAKIPFSVILDSLRHVNIAGPPGMYYGYQNVVFSLYDTIAAVKTGKIFENLLQEKMFDPLGMNNASAGLEAFIQNSNRAMPHRRTGNGYQALPLNDRYYNTNPAAGINASISDMGRFLSAITANDSSLLPPAIPDTVLSPQIISPLRWIYLRRWTGVESKYYGLGWRIIGYKGRQIAYHGGYISGYRAEIAVCREEGLGIAFLSNAPGRVGSEVVPALLDMWFSSEQDAPLITDKPLND